MSFPKILIRPRPQSLAQITSTAAAGKLTAIEGLRGVAMSFVFFGHFETLFRHFLPVNSISARVLEYLAVWGHGGTAFFMVISGFFVYRTFIEGRGEYQSFLRKRFLRIFSLYWFVLALYLCLSTLFPLESKLPAGIS
jgi:peptidoglycan/LPS O-acetylase OafA/YrhL